MSWTREIETAEAIAREASAVLLRYYRGEYEVSTKAGAEPVTEADRAANALIVQRLSEEFPADGVLAEESIGDLPVPTAGGRVWMVDPMDGTREFMRHTDEFAVMIGLAINGRPRLGVVVQPATGTLFRGVVGEGAEVVDGAGQARPMRVRSETDPARLRLVCSRSHLPPLVEEMMRRLGIREMLRSGSVGLKIGKIGTGVCDLYLHPSGGTKLWDACAPEAILRAAGGRLTDFDGGAVVYDPRHLHNERGLLASNGAAHEAVLAAVRDLF